MAYLRPGFFVRRIADPLAALFGAATTLAVPGRRPVGRQVKAQFEKLPDPADHPVFRIEAA